MVPLSYTANGGAVILTETLPKGFLLSKRSALIHRGGDHVT